MRKKLIGVFLILLAVLILLQGYFDKMGHQHSGP